jgi:hypothetical protein
METDRAWNRTCLPCRTGTRKGSRIQFPGIIFFKTGRSFSFEEVGGFFPVLVSVFPQKIGACESSDRVLQ